MQKPFIAEKTIKNYQVSLKTVLGRGAYGTVYLGNNIINNQKVAMKVIPQKFIMQENAQNMVQQEIEIMKKFNHPNIVLLLDVLDSMNNKYIITEYCNGPDLRDFLRQSGILKEQDALKILMDILAGLQEIVNSGIIHRDLKPANVIRHNKNFKITDFGFSRQFDSFEMMESLVGTPLYMAPQILKRQQYTQKCDIWSLGLIYYEMLHGKTPWMAGNIPDLLQKIQMEPLKFASNITQTSKNFIMGCLQIEESKRVTWEQVFNHPLIKPPKFELQFNPENVKKMFAEKIKQQQQPIVQNYCTQRTQEDPELPLIPQIRLLRERSASTQQLILYHANLNIKSPQHNIAQDLKLLKPPIQIISNTSSQSTNTNSQKTNSKPQENKSTIPQEPGRQRLPQRARQQEFYVPCNQLKEVGNIERMRRTKSQLDQLPQVACITQTDIDIVTNTKYPNTLKYTQQQKHQRNIHSIFGIVANKDANKENQPLQTNRQQGQKSTLMNQMNKKPQVTKQ